jgi:Methyl-accepting chemotaxis protein
MDLHKIRISQKIMAVALLLTILPVTIVGFYAYEQTAAGTLAQLEDSLEGQMLIEKDYVDSTFSLAQDKVNSDLGVARSLFYAKGDPSIVDGQLVLGGDYVVNGNYEIVDNIKSMVGGTATVFQVENGEAVRISTNVINDAGERAVGTTVSQPVYDTVVNNGETFYGKAWVVNAWYLTAYEPIMDSSGKIIGILYVGVLEDPFINTIREHMAQIVVGETGYVYVMDSQGNLILHPNMEGQNLFDQDFAKEIISTKEGTIEYDWEGREKIASFTYYEPNDWYIVSSSYVEEFEGPLMAIKNSLIVAVLIFIILGALAAFFLSRSISGGIGRIVTDFEDMANATTMGQLDRRANTDVGIDFEAIPRGFNQVLDAVIMPLNVAAEYVDRISKGDIPPHITDEYHGDFNEIKNNMNQCIDSITALVSDANLLSAAAVEGKLDVRADASKHNGDYRAIITGVNDTLDAVIGPLNVAAEYVDRIAHGDVPPRITETYYGDFNEIKNNLNGCIDAINALIKDANLLSAAAVEGKLDVRADASKHNGDYRSIINGVNDTLDAVINPLNVAAEYIDRISHGDIPSHITDDYSGDFSEIKNNLNGCIDAINALVSDANLLSAAAVDGKLDVRANASRHDGDYRSIINGVNDTLDAVISPLNVAAEYIDLIAHGDIPPHISDDYNGDFNEIKDNLNGCIDAINELVSDANLLSEAAVDGKLDVRADASKHNGDYRAIIDGVNDTLDSVISPLNVAAEYVDRIAHGDIPPHITDDYSGDFNEIKSNLNGCIDAINALISDSNMLSAAAVDGQLDVRADASKHDGDYRVIIEGVNNTLDAVIDPLNVAAEYVDRIAHGDIPQEITDDYSGDFNKIKNNLNMCIAAINALISDVNMLSAATIEGRLDVRADVSRHQGDYGTIVEGVNNTLEAVICPLNVTAEYFDRISKGDIPPIITDVYCGDFNTIKNNLNTCIEAINNLVEDADMLARAGVNGQLDVRADTSRHQGDYLKIVDGFNNCLDTVVDPVNEASRVITAYSQGDLDTRIRISTKGDFRVLSDTLDGFGDTLQGIIEDSCEVLESIASNDLTREVRVHGVGDFMELTGGVEKCRHSLNDIVALVTENAESIAYTSQEMSAVTEQLSSSADQITNTVNEISMGTQLQASKAQDVSSAMVDMSRMVQEVAINSEMASKNAVDSNALIQSLGDMSEDLMHMMESIKSAVGDSSSVITDLDVKSNRIGEIVNLITSIADQTNLLALNAAIEAARAGDHGRGFAVVADEVRKLAEDSGNAAKQISELIVQMQSGTKNAVNSMQRGSEEVHKGAESLGNSVKAISDVVEAGNTIVKMVQEIAEATEEQSASIEEVNSSVNEVSTISEQSAAGAQEASASVQEQTASMQELSHSAQELAEVASRMQLVVSKFKLDGSVSIVNDEPVDDLKDSFSSSSSGKLHPDISNDALI